MTSFKQIAFVDQTARYQRTVRLTLQDSNDNSGGR